MEPHEEVRKVAVVVITADRGLCGSFNNGLLRTMDTFLWEQKQDSDAFEAPEFLAFGKKGRDYLKRRDAHLGRVAIELKPADFPDQVAKLVSELTTRFAAGDIDEVHLVYNRFVSTLNQEPTIEKLFPLGNLGADEDGEPEHLVDFVYEPSQAAILNDVLPLFLRTRITQVFLESDAGEHAARMTAMDSATRNARDVIDSLTTQYNRARQAAITRELVEIVAGAEAL
jgi:F-type H+-transporting ATPase subunit gamma